MTLILGALCGVVLAHRLWVGTPSTVVRRGLVLSLLHRGQLRHAIALLLWCMVLLPMLFGLTSYGLGAPGMVVVPVAVMAAAWLLPSAHGNAMKHAFEGRGTGQLQLRAEALDNDWVRIRVTDDGVGIPSDNLPRVFDFFFTTKLGQGGSGLGLRIAHNIVSGMLDGRIQVHSEARRGSEFCVELQRVAPQATEPPSPVSAPAGPVLAGKPIDEPRSTRPSRSVLGAHPTRRAYHAAKFRESQVRTIAPFSADSSGGDRRLLSAVSVAIKERLDLALDSRGDQPCLVRMATDPACHGGRPRVSRLWRRLNWCRACLVMGRRWDSPHTLGCGRGCCQPRRDGADRISAQIVALAATTTCGGRLGFQT